MITIETIAEHIASRHAVSVHCNNQGCRNHRVLDLKALAERLGADCSMLHDSLAPRLKCAECGGKDIGFIRHAPTTRLPDGTWGNSFMNEDGSVTDC